MIPEDARHTAALAKANYTVVHGRPQPSGRRRAPQYNRGSPPTYSRPALRDTVLDIEEVAEIEPSDVLMAQEDPAPEVTKPKVGIELGGSQALAALLPCQPRRKGGVHPAERGGTEAHERQSHTNPQRSFTRRQRVLTQLR